MAGKVRISIYRNDVCIYSGACKHSDAAAAIKEFLKLCDSASYEVIAYADSECILDLCGSVERICDLLTKGTRFNT
jgi:hypothetical protein